MYINYKECAWSAPAHRAHWACTLAHVHMGGYVDALACTCQRFGALVHWSVGASLGVLLLRRITGVIFATLRVAGRWRVGTLVHRRIGASAHRRIGASAHRRIGASAHRRIGASAHRRIGTLALLARARALACTSIGEERWRGESTLAVRRQK